MTETKNVFKAKNASDARESFVAGDFDWELNSKKSKRRPIAIVTVAVVAASVLLFARLASSDSGKIKTVRADNGTVERRLLLEGRAKPAQTYSLSFPIPAADDNVGPNIAEVLVKAGDRVSSGQILARLEGEHVESALVRSPTDGVVVEVRGAAGAPPPAGAVVVVRTLDLVAEFELTEANLSELKEGMEATMTVPVLSQSIPTVIEKLPQDPKSSVPFSVSLGSAQGGGTQSGSDQALNYPLEIPLPRIDGLRPGMTVDLDVLVARKTDVLVVPQTAIRYDQDGAFVEVVDGRKTHPVRVKTGLSDQSNIEILEGLSGGENVVIQGN
ncbi:MAG: hypothetical protein C4318_02445 [Acidimicrobiia bacterium]